MVPKVIHYCWFGGNPIPRNVKRCIESWKKYCPDYKIKRWDESNFDVSAHPFMKAAYEARAWAFVSDYARLKIIYDEGGIYLDTDVELLKPLDDLCRYDCYFGIQQDRKLVNTGLGFGAIAKHSVVRLMLFEYDKVKFDNSNLLEIACPIMNTRALVNVGYIQNGIKQDILGATIFETYYFDPISPGKNNNLICNDTVSIHHYSATWTPFTNRIKRRVINALGNDFVTIIKRILKKDTS